MQIKKIEFDRPMDVAGKKAVSILRSGDNCRIAIDDPAFIHIETPETGVQAVPLARVVVLDLMPDEDDAPGVVRKRRK